LWQFFCFRQSEKKRRKWTADAAENDKRRVVEKAAGKLKEMDALLNQEGRRHLIFITPTRSQVKGAAEKDPLVQSVLREHGLTARYILDELGGRGLSDRQKASLFYDSVHLSATGHEIWASVIRGALEQLVGDG
jgi:hypothetical protein